MTDRFQYNYYLNIRKAFLNPQYRGLESNDPELKYEEFSKILLDQKFIALKCKYPSNFRRHEYRGRIALAVLTRYDSDVHRHSRDLVSLLDKLSTISEVQTTETTDLFLITNEVLTKRTIKKVKEYKQFAVTNILSVRFAVELPKANLCSKHEIASPEESQKLAEECYVMIDKLKYITEDDAQNIWVGGFPGEVIKITRTSVMSGYALDYRYVTGVITRTESSEAAEEEEEENDD